MKFSHHKYFFKKKKITNIIVYGFWHFENEKYVKACDSMLVNGAQ